jgi:hypothetical protein
VACIKLWEIQSSRHLKETREVALFGAFLQCYMPITRKSKISFMLAVVMRIGTYREEFVLEKNKGDESLFLS